MRTRPDAHQETLSRRLALLRAELEAERAPAPDGSTLADNSADDNGDSNGAWWEGHTIVPTAEAPAASEPLAPLLQQQPAAAIAVPVPGRHAARRSVPLPPLPELVPGVLRGHARLGPAQLAVVALGLAAALALTCWWLARGRPTTITSPPLVAATGTPFATLAPAAGGVATGAAVAAPPGSAASGSASGAASAGARVTVDVEGKVRHPGIVVVPAGSRVTDALAAAGGVARHRLLAGLNLAAVLVDGQQITVGAPAGGSVASSAGGGGSGGGGAAPTTGGSAGGALVNLNTATAEELDTLPGVGPVTAQSILEWRQENGSFTSVQELLEVDGIGPKTLAQIAPHATV